MVLIYDTNVVNGILVHNWGKLLREQFGRTTNAKTLQDVRNATDNGMYNALINEVKLNFDTPPSDSSGGGSVYGGDVNRLANAGGDGSGGNGSTGDPNGSNNIMIQNRWNGKDSDEDK